jgi:hypothetical protein
MEAASLIDVQDETEPATGENVLLDTPRLLHSYFPLVGWRRCRWPAGGFARGGSLFLTASFSFRPKLLSPSLDARFVMKVLFVPAM